MVGEGAVYRGLVDERVPTFSGQDFPLLFMVTHVGVVTEGQQGDDHVQVVVRPHVGEHLIQ